MENGKRKRRVGLIHLAGTFVTGLALGLAIGNIRSDVPKVAAPVVFPTAAPTASPDPHAAFTLDNVLVRLNEARLAHGLPQLRTDSYLASEARKDLAGNCPVTGHDTFRSNFDKGEFKNYAGVAEDLISGNDTPLGAINGLLGSPTHADIMVGPSYGWTIVGVAVITTPVNCVSLIFGK